MMIDYGPKACFMKDRKGYLPAHVACSRHCSPVKLKMLLDVNPAALFEKTADGHTLLSLATSTATNTHPNFILIDAIKEHLDAAMQCQPKNFVPLLPNDGPRDRRDLLSASQRIKKRTRFDLQSKNGVVSWQEESRNVQFAGLPTKRRRRNPAARDDSESPVDLLLHFSRSSTGQNDNMEEPKCMVEV